MAVAGIATFDVIVIGSGFAGLSAASRLAGRGARVLVLAARSRLGGRATAFQDRDTGELVDNGQHVMLGCYVETLAFLDQIGAAGNITVQPQLSVSMIDRRGRRSRLTCPATLPPPMHLIAGVLEWDALSWRDRISAFAMTTPLKLAYRESQPGPQRRAASPGETVENWLIRNRQTAAIREMLWNPLALAALNQSPAKASAPPFARVLGEMFGGDARAAAIVTVNLWFDRPVIDEPFLGLPGRAMQWVFDKRTMFGGTASHLSLVSSGAGPLVERSNEDLIAEAHRELIEALPDIRAARLMRATVIREPRATFSLAPGQPARPATETGIRGFYLAGDWIDTGLPATIESAVRSGHRAATLCELR